EQRLQHEAGSRQGVVRDVADAHDCFPPQKQYGDGDDGCEPPHQRVMWAGGRTEVLSLIRVAPRWWSCIACCRHTNALTSAASSAFDNSAQRAKYCAVARKPGGRGSGASMRASCTTRPGRAPITSTRWLRNTAS